MKWQTGKPPKNGLYFVKSKLREVDCGIGKYMNWDGAICGLSCEWSVDAAKVEWAGPIEPPKEGGVR